MQYFSTKRCCGLLYKNLISIKIGVGVAILSVDDLKPGMVLTASVYNQQELLLLEKDTALTKKRIWILKTWGIKQVSVKGKQYWSVQITGSLTRGDKKPGSAGVSAN